MLELDYNFFHNYCDKHKFDELKMNTGSLYLTLAEKKLDYNISPKNKTQGSQTRQSDCRIDFIADAKKTFFKGTCCAVHKKT